MPLPLCCTKKTLPPVLFLTLLLMNTSENNKSLSYWNLLRISNEVNKGSDHHFYGLPYMKLFETRRSGRLEMFVMNNNNNEEMVDHHR